VINLAMDLKDKLKVLKSVLERISADTGVVLFAADSLLGEVESCSNLNYYLRDIQKEMSSMSSSTQDYTNEIDRLLKEIEK